MHPAINRYTPPNQHFDSVEEMWDAAAEYALQHPSDTILCNDNPDARQIGYTAVDGRECWSVDVKVYLDYMNDHVELDPDMSPTSFDIRAISAGAINQGIKLKNFDPKNFRLLADVHLT